MYHLRWLSLALCTVLASSRALEGGIQHPLAAPPEATVGGVVRRFPKLHDQKWDASHLGAAQILHSGPSHIDAWYPDGYSHPEPPVADVGSLHVSRPNVADVLRSVADWDLRSFANSSYHSFYHPLDEVEEFMRKMAEDFPSFVTLSNLGHSGEGREMQAMRISKDGDLPRRLQSRKYGFVISGAQHAREWVATATAMYIAHALVADATETFSLSPLLDYLDFYIIPIPNPDGYVHTWTHDRLWYKNRQNIGPNESCLGIDLNRNWGFKWKSRSGSPSLTPTNGTAEAVADPCSQWYPGHRPFEAHEVNNIANYITTLPDLRAYIDLRSYGQMLSTPFSYSCTKYPKDAENQSEAALGAVNAIKQTHGTVFTTGSLCQQLYRASGNIIDWMYKRAGIKYPFTVHLRDTGTYGFSLPAHLIRPVGEETANMIQFIARFIDGRTRNPYRA